MTTETELARLVRYFEGIPAPEKRKWTPPSSGESTGSWSSGTPTQPAVPSEMARFAEFLQALGQQRTARQADYYSNLPGSADLRGQEQAHQGEMRDAVDGLGMSGGQSDAGFFQGRGLRGPNAPTRPENPFGGGQPTSVYFTPGGVVGDREARRRFASEVLGLKY